VKNRAGAAERIEGNTWRAGRRARRDTRGTHGNAEISRRPGPVSYDENVAKRIGELLVEGGVLSQSQLEQALFAQRKDGRKLGQLLVDLGFVSEIQVTQTLSRQLSVPWVSLYHVDFSRSLLNLVPRELAEKYCLVPIFVRRVRKQGETLYIAMDDPTSESVIAEVEKALTGDAVLWLTDRRGRRVGVPSARVAYVELGAPEGARRSVGFGTP